jgi:hypothetical protein
VDGDALEEKKEESSGDILNQGEFQHLQQGVLGVFYQNEHHTKLILERLAELAEKWKEYEQKCDERFLKLESFMIHTSDSVNELGEKIKFLAKKK